MRIGIPMRVLENDGVIALCAARGVRRHIRMLMVDDCPPGTWVMTSLGIARARLDEADALQIDRLLDELDTDHLAAIDGLARPPPRRHPAGGGARLSGAHPCYLPLVPEWSEPGVWCE